MADLPVGPFRRHRPGSSVLGTRPARERHGGFTGPQRVFVL